MGCGCRCLFRTAASERTEPAAKQSCPAQSNLVSHAEAELHLARVIGLRGYYAEVRVARRQTNRGRSLETVEGVEGLHAEDDAVLLRHLGCLRQRDIGVVNALSE